MLQVVVGPKHQIVIPKEVRKKIKDLKPGVKVSVYAVDKKTIEVQVKPDVYVWIEKTRGMTKKAWKGMDPVAELDKMRDQWHEKR